MEEERLVYGVFSDETAASRAVDELAEKRFTTADITVLSREADRGQHRVEEGPTHARSRGANGGAIGADAGAIGGLALGFVGPWFGAGPMLVALQAALDGGATGAAVGLFAGLDLECEEIDLTAEHFPPGAFLVGVTTTKRLEDARAALRAASAPAVFARSSRAAFEAFRKAAEARQTGEPNDRAKEADEAREESVFVDAIDEAGRESFPASDPPSWNP